MPVGRGRGICYRVGMNDDDHVLFRGRIITLTQQEVALPNGVRTELEIVHHPGGAAIVAIDDRRRVCLLRQYRHAVGEWLWELPAGKLDAHEPPAETARRELAEEAGCTARTWRELGYMISSPGVFTERVWCYLATDLEPTATAHEAEEVIEVHWLAFDEAVAMAMDGRISDAKSVIALCRARAVLAG